jgi:hypothetical protein
VRTYGRVNNEDGTKTWVEVETDTNGYSDGVWLTTLLQVLKLNLNESPFYGNYGVPAYPSVIQQVFPDYYASLTQQQFSGYFASLIISKQQASDRGFPYPSYQVNVVTNYGAKLAETVASRIPG